MSNAQDKKPCRRCLLQDMQGKEAEYYQSVLRYRKSLPAGKGVSDEEYEKRLAACRTCGQLVNGTCSQCGCYVEMRAAAKRMACPLPGGNRWQ